MLKRLTILALFFILSPFPLSAQGTPDQVKLEPYPRKLGEQISVGKNVVSNGIPVSIEHFRTNDPVDRVIEFYEQQWQMKGHKFINREQMGEISVLTAIVDLEKSLVKSVMAYWEPNEKVTYVFPSSSILDLSGFGKNPKDIPIMPGSTVMTSTESNEGGKRMLMVVHRNQESIPKNLAFYRSQFHLHGWRPISNMEKPEEAKEGEFLFFMRKGATCFISISIESGETFVIINLME